ncbi:MAG: MlaD family protein [Lutibacter sp.]
MNTHSTKFKVRLGLFVAAGFVLFAIAIFLIGRQKNMFNPVFSLSTTFYNVSGLQVGNNIRFSGINVGTVDNIKIINDSTVLVNMLVQKDVQRFIKTDGMVQISSEGIIGDRVLVITQGSAETESVKGGQFLKSVEPIETDAIMASLQVTAENAEVITKELAMVMLKVNSGRGTLGRLIHDSIIAQNINSTISNFQSSSQKFDEMISLSKNDISKIMTSFRATAGNAEVSTQQLEEIMVKLNTGSGTMSRLINDSTTASNVDETILNLKTSTKSLDENLEALKHNFLFRGYFRKKEKEALKIKEDSIKAAKNNKTNPIIN